MNEILNNKNNDISDFKSNLEDLITSGVMIDIISDISNGKSPLILNYENFKCQISTTNNKIESENISKINLGECETRLKEKYNISQDESLILFQIDTIEDGNTKVEYDIYDSKTYKKLNLSVCKDILIEIAVPKIINKKEEYKYDINSSYYNDICFIYDSDDGLDMTLSERKQKLKEQNLCEPNCEYKGYNFSTSKSICSCITKSPENNKNNGLILNTFYEASNFQSLELLKCYKSLFTIIGIKKNIGFFILSLFILINILSIKKIVQDINHIQDIISKIICFYEIIIGRKNFFSNTKNSSPPKMYNSYVNKMKNNNSKIYYNKKRIYFHNSSSSNRNIINSKTNILRKTNIISKTKIINNDKMKLTINEVNSLPYEIAQKYDKRNYFQIYISYLKVKQAIIYSFFINDDYNSKGIKISSFFINFATTITINTFFFDESTMHKIYEDEGKYNLSHQIKQIIFSTLITIIINTILNILAYSEKQIIKFKFNKETKEIRTKGLKLMKCIKIKFIIYIILSSFLLIFYWYFVSCFCTIYRNTQFHLFKDTMLSYLFSLLYPILLCMIPTTLRHIALCAQKGDRKNIYKLSLLFN